MHLLFNKQDIVESVCVYTSVKEETNREQIHADISFNPAFGFSAIANTSGRMKSLNEKDLIDAVAVYLQEYHNFNPDLLFVDLRYSTADGITASIQVKNF